MLMRRNVDRIMKRIRMQMDKRVLMGQRSNELPEEIRMLNCILGGSGAVQRCDARLWSLHKFLGKSISHSFRALNRHRQMQMKSNEIMRCMSREKERQRSRDGQLIIWLCIALQRRRRDVDFDDVGIFNLQVSCSSCLLNFGGH